MLEIILPKLIEYTQFTFGFIVLLGGVIAIHEFGHFICAKYVGARVDIFSIGFGPIIWKKTFRGTEYRISIIPLGGFVKIYGQDPEEVAEDENPDPEQSLAHKKLWQRLLVFAGGPAFNFFLAIAIFSFIAMLGVQKLPSTATRIVAYSPAWNSGLRSGDKILEVNQQKVVSYEDLMKALVPHNGKNIDIKIRRHGKEHTLNIAIQETVSFTPYGEQIKSGTIEGLEPRGRAPIVATTKESKETTWGLRSGDEIKSIQNEAIYSWEDIEDFFDRHINKLPNTLSFKIVRDSKPQTITTPDLSWLQNRIQNSDSWNSQRLLETVGLHSTELFIKSTVPGTPADIAGLKPSDRIISVNGQKVYSFEALRKYIKKAGEDAREKNPNTNDFKNAVNLLIERNGEALRVDSSVLASKGKDPIGNTIVTYAIGIESQGLMKMPRDMILSRTLNPFTALFTGVKETVIQSSMTLIGIKKLFFQEVSMKAMGGPIMIAKVAGDAFIHSWRAFLRVMAFISIALGVFNLLPFPILDGGHIALALIEAVRGKPFSNDILQNFLKVGIVMLLMLMVFVTYNDIMKLSFFN